MDAWKSSHLEGDTPRNRSGIALIVAAMGLAVFASQAGAQDLRAMQSDAAIVKAAMTKGANNPEIYEGRIIGPTVTAKGNWWNIVKVAKGSDPCRFTILTDERDFASDRAKLFGVAQTIDWSNWHFAVVNPGDQYPVFSFTRDDRQRIMGFDLPRDPEVAIAAERLSKACRDRRHAALIARSEAMRSHTSFDDLRKLDLDSAVPVSPLKVDQLRGADELRKFGLYAGMPGHLWSGQYRPTGTALIKGFWTYSWNPRSRTLTQSGIDQLGRSWKHPITRENGKLVKRNENGAVLAVGEMVGKDEVIWTLTGYDIRHHEWSYWNATDGGRTNSHREMYEKWNSRTRKWEQTGAPYPLFQVIWTRLTDKDFVSAMTNAKELIAEGERRYAERKARDEAQREARARRFGPMRQLAGTVGRYRVAAPDPISERSAQWDQFRRFSWSVEGPSSTMYAKVYDGYGRHLYTERFYAGEDGMIRWSRYQAGKDEIFADTPVAKGTFASSRIETPKQGMTDYVLTRDESSFAVPMQLITPEAFFAKTDDWYRLGSFIYEERAQQARARRAAAEAQEAMRRRASWETYFAQLRQRMMIANLQNMNLAYGGNGRLYTPLPYMSSSSSSSSDDGDDSGGSDGYAASDSDYAEAYATDADRASGSGGSTASSGQGGQASLDSLARSSGDAYLANTSAGTSAFFEAEGSAPSTSSNGSGSAGSSRESGTGSLTLIVKDDSKERAARAAAEEARQLRAQQAASAREAQEAARAADRRSADAARQAEREAEREAFYRRFPACRPSSGPRPPGSTARVSCQ